MLIIPAVDIKDGKCVRLVQGNMDRDTVYDDIPWRMARRWQDAGGSFLHIVDLNGAFAGHGVNDDAVADILANTDMKTELGGGIRDIGRITKLLDMGIGRVILGTVAVEDPDLVRQAIDQYGPERIVVGIDARNGIAKTRGWASNGGVPAISLARNMQKLGVIRVVYTDISRDGMLLGPNINDTEKIARATGLKIVASGGVSTIDDIRGLKRLESAGVEAVITGKALYEGRLDLAEAIRAAR
jgi:phosphoribosylformimino-5-aminoimidazole carboxamide ribotide isomerase